MLHFKEWVRVLTSATILGFSPVQAADLGGPSPSTPGVITTLAGNGKLGFLGDRGPATSASMMEPHGVAVDARGNVYFADSGNLRIRRVATDGTIDTIAGNGVFGHSGDGGFAIAARMMHPSGVAVDTRGNVYIADTSNNRIRKVNARGIITTLAGDGADRFRGDGEPANLASLSVPMGVAVDTRGNVYIADTNNDRIRKVATNGVITTLARLNDPNALAVDRSGNVYITSWSSALIRRMAADTGTIDTIAGNGYVGFSGDKGPATLASMDYPNGVAVDDSENVYFTDTHNKRIRKVTLEPTITLTPFRNAYLDYLRVDWTSPHASGDAIVTITGPMTGPRKEKRIISQDLSGTKGFIYYELETIHFWTTWTYTITVTTRSSSGLTSTSEATFTQPRAKK